MATWKHLASLWMAMVIAVFAYTLSAVAAPVSELELDNTATNNTIATAQFIPTSAFTLPAPSTAQSFQTANISGVVGFNQPCPPSCTSDRDFYSFVANGGGLIADINFSFGDHTLGLFNSGGILIGFNDDGHQPGEDPHKPFLVASLPGPGVYFIEVSLFGEGTSGPQPPFGLFQRPYVLELSVQSPVPEPSTLVLIGSGLAALHLTYQSRRRRG